MPILQEHKKLLSTQSENKTLTEWVDFFESKYTKNQIYSFCRKNHYPIKKLSKAEVSKMQSKNRKYHINQDYFKVWSRNMAYVLGLWFANGCIYSGKIFDITMHAKDKYILKQVAKELGYEGILYDYVDRQAVRLNFSCAVIYNDLLALGCTENKNLALRFPNIPNEYLGDFIRGYFDGNGSVIDLKNNRFNTVIVCESKEFLNTLHFILKNKCGVKGGSYDKESMCLKFGKRDSILIGKFIYKDNPELFLQRKRKKFQKYIKEENI